MSQVQEVAGQIAGVTAMTDVDSFPDENLG